MSKKTDESAPRMETRPYPGSRYQPVVSVILLALSSVLFFSSKTIDLVQSTAVFVAFASLTFVVAIVPQYREFSSMRGELVKDGVAGSRGGRGAGGPVSLAALLVVLLVAPVVLILVAPPGLFLGALTGIISGFSGFQLVFTLYVGHWSRAHGLRLYRYTISSGEGGRRLVVEYGLKAEAMRVG